jgi:hypothetical protein
MSYSFNMYNYQGEPTFVDGNERPEPHNIRKAPSLPHPAVLLAAPPAPP